MNKFIKGCLYVAGILTALGLIFFVLGAVFGGVRQVIQLGRSGAFHCASLTPDGLHVAVDTGRFDIGDLDDDCDIGDFDAGEIDIDEADLIDYTKDDLGTADDIDAVDISLGAGELYIREAEDDQYHLEANQVYKLKCYEKDGVLHVHCKGLAADSNTLKKQRVILYIPADEMLEDMDVQLGAGVGKIEHVTSDSLSVEVGAGELKGNNIVSSDAVIEVGAGNVELRECELGDAEYQVGLGSVYYQGSITGDAEVSCSMGSVELNVDGNEEDFDYRIECAMGAVNVGSRQFAGISGDKRIENDADHLMNIECAMGNIIVKFK